MNYHIERFCKRMGCIILLVCAVIFIARGSKDSQSEPYHNEYADDDTVSQESITYTIDGTKKEILTSDSGEICVKVPQWEELTTVYLTEEYGHKVLHMSNDATYDKMTYEMIAAWDNKEAEEEIFRFFPYGYLKGKISHLTVNGIDVCYMPCLRVSYNEGKSWHYIIWGDLGCGQVLKTEITQGLYGEPYYIRDMIEIARGFRDGEALNILGIIEMIYSDIEIYSAQGDAIPVVYSESLPEKDEKALFEFRFGVVRDYKTDEYRETTVCAELIESLYAAVQEGTIEELLQRESVEAKELSIVERLDYIKKEETGTLIKYAAGHAYDSIMPTKYCLVEEADDSKEIFAALDWGYAEWFLCEKDSTGTIRAQKGISIYYYNETSEPYFLSYQGNPYLCIVDHDAEGEVERVVLYDFITPDYIGTLICMDASSLRLCSYVRNEGTYGTTAPWYRHMDNSIDSGKEYYAILGQWAITEYLGESDYRHVGNTDSEAYAGEQELTQKIVDTYLGQELEMSRDWRSISVDTFGSASEYGYYYTSLENLYKVYGQPEALDMEAPVFCATIHPNYFKRDIDIIVDNNGKAAICIEGRFFRLERCEEEELRTWE